VEKCRKSVFKEPSLRHEHRNGQHELQKEEGTRILGGI